MQHFEVTINEIKYRVESKSALDATLQVLDALHLRYEFTDFEVREIDVSNNRNNQLAN